MIEEGAVFEALFDMIYKLLLSSLYESSPATTQASAVYIMSWAPHYSQTGRTGTQQIAEVSPGIPQQVLSGRCPRIGTGAESDCVKVEFASVTQR